MASTFSLVMLLVFADGTYAVDNSSLVACAQWAEHIRSGDLPTMARSDNGDPRVVMSMCLPPEALAQWTAKE